MSDTQNASLSRAKINKEDEFYTQLEDVERELKRKRLINDALAPSSLPHPIATV